MLNATFEEKNWRIDWKYLS